MKKKTQMLGKMLLTTMMMALTLPQATASGFTVSYSNVEQQQLNEELLLTKMDTMLSA